MCVRETSPNLVNEDMISVLRGGGAAGNELYEHSCWDQRSRHCQS